MSKLVYKYMRYEIGTQVTDVNTWTTPSRMKTIRHKLPGAPECEVFQDDEYLSNCIVKIWRYCDESPSKVCTLNVKQSFKEYLIEVLNDLGLIFIIKRITVFDKVYEENERYEKDGVMHFPCELDYVYWLLGMSVHGNYVPLFGKIHPLFDSVEAFQDAIVEGKSNWEFMVFTTKEDARERLDKPAMVRYIRDNGKRFEAYKNAYDYAKRKKEER